MTLLAGYGRLGNRTRRRKDCDDPLSGHCSAMACREVDVIYLKANRSATSMAAKKKRRRGRLIHCPAGAPEDGAEGSMNTELHAVCDSQGQPISRFVTAGKVSDYIDARALLSSIPDVGWLLGDRSYDADWFRDASKNRGMSA